MIVAKGMKVRIAAPDAPSAFLLERSLARLRPATTVRADGWFVELILHESEDEAAVEAAVRRWLRESAVDATTVEYDDGLRRVRIEA